MKMKKLLGMLFPGMTYLPDFPVAPDQIRKKAEQDKIIKALRLTMPKW